MPSLTDYGFERGNDLFSFGAEVRDRLGIRRRRRVTSGRVTLHEVVDELLDIVAERESEADRPA